MARLALARAVALAAQPLIAAIVSVSLCAQTASRPPSSVKPSETWTAISRLCRSAPVTPSPTSREIARAARDEYYRFGGHRIDATGRLFSFGVVESEQEEDAQAIGDGGYRLSHLGWWNVLGYWALLGESRSVTAAAREFLRLKGFRDATARLEDGETTPLPNLKLREALDVLDKALSVPPGATPTESARRQALRETLTQALIRAAVNDVAWSAAFVSSVMRKAKLDPSRFEYADAHQIYIHKAVDTAVAETERASPSHMYRACPPPDAPLRVGDLVCYHRVKTLDGLSRVELREMVLADRGLDRDDRRVKASHCDVVAHIDGRARLAYVIGGNVQQSVTVKQLALRPMSGRRGGGLVLAQDQPDGCRRTLRWTLPGPSPGVDKAPHLTDECSLNRKPWFVVLQAR